MIEYTVVLLKATGEGVRVRHYLHAARSDGRQLSAAKLTQEIRGGMFDATLEFTMDTFHPEYGQTITPMKDTVLVYDGYDEIFRGRPVSVKTDSRGRRTVTCEADIHFLKDVPDLFSERRTAGKVYKIGSEKGAQRLTMTEIPQGDIYPVKVLPPSPTQNLPCQLSRFGEKQSWNGKTVYRSEVTQATEAETDYGKRVGVAVTGYGNTRFENYLLQAEDVGKTFTVELGSSRAYELPLHTATCQVTMYYGQGIYDQYWQRKEVVEGVIRYMGNLALIARVNGPYNMDNFDAAEEVIEMRPHAGTVEAGTLDFCIVQYCMAPHWHMSREDLLFWSPASETIFYQAQSAGPTDVQLSVYRNEGTTVRAMVNGILNRYGEDDRGYNRYAGEQRKIYRGHIEADGAVTYESVDTCYASLEKWLSETGGYARIVVRNVGEGEDTAAAHFLDLTLDSGEKSDDFFVRRGENLMDLTTLQEGDGMATGIYVRGVWEGNDGEDGEADPDYELLLTSLNEEDAASAQEMDPDGSPCYRYTGEGESYFPKSDRHSGLYRFAGGGWKEVPQQEVHDTPTTVDSPFKMTDTGITYRYNNEQVIYRNGRYYVYHKAKLIFIEDKERTYPTAESGFSLDPVLGVIWNDEAKDLYGMIVAYIEVDVSVAMDASRMQFMVDRGQEELRKRLTAFETLSVSAADPRLIGLPGAAPVLGNYYRAADHFTREMDYKQLSKIDADLIKPSRGKLTFGKKRNTLSAYVREKGERL